MVISRKDIGALEMKHLGFTRDVFFLCKKLSNKYQTFLNRERPLTTKKQRQSDQMIRKPLFTNPKPPYIRSRVLLM